jgi:predicted Zn-dependent protease
MRRGIAGMLLAAALAAGCGTTVQNPVTGKAERSVMDESAEIAEGRKAHPQVLAEYGVVDDARVQAYVDGIGQRLASQSHRANLKWTFTVLDSPEVNAFALPGGYVYVTRGLMAYMENEAELAGVIGHEIGHVTARHGAQRATRQQNASLGVLGATVLGAVLEGYGVRGATELAAQASQTAAAGWLAGYSREQELQADQLGAEYLTRVQRDPRHMVRVIEVLRSQERYAADRARAEGRQPPAQSWLATHPSNEQRLREIERVAAELKAPTRDDEGRERYLQVLQGLTFGDSRAQGVVRGQDFLHEPLGLAVTAPPGWKLVNSASAVMLAAPDGSAALLVQAVPKEAGSSPDEILRRYVRADQGRAERRNLNGLEAVHFAGTRLTQQGQPQNVRATIVRGPPAGPAGAQYALVYAARDAAAMQRALPALTQAEASFRPLTAADRAKARPWTITTTPMPAGGLRSLAARSPLPDAENQLRLLNGIYGGGAEPPAGTRVKTVE